MCLCCAANWGGCTGFLGPLNYRKTRATIDFGNGVLYDESKTWTDYKAMVASGLLKPEIAVGWYFNMPTETPKDLEEVRARYMPEIEVLAAGDA